jgi:hypothetical protein
LLGLDFDSIIQQWAEHMEKHGTPDNINGTLIGFVKNKGAGLDNAERLFRSYGYGSS